MDAKVGTTCDAIRAQMMSLRLDPHRDRVE